MAALIKYQCNRPGLCYFPNDAAAQAQCIAQCEAIPGWFKAKRSPEPLSSEFVSRVYPHL